MSKKILITPRSFGKSDASAIERIKAAGYEPVMNPEGMILTKEQMKALIADCIGVIIGVDPLDEEVLKCAPALKAVAKYGVGTDNIDLDYCSQNGIAVSIARGANADAVADYAFTLLCACARKVCLINDKCHNKDWSKNLGLDIYGKRIGILGLGAVGKGMAKRAKGFSMEVLAYDVYWDAEFAKANEIRYALPEEILSTCDFISLHLPLTPETEGIINKDSLSLMKPKAVLVNTARGGLIKDEDLIEALTAKKIAAAGIDVFSQAPPADERWYTLDNLIMSSHAAASTDGASENMTNYSTDNILRDLQGADI